MNNLYRITCWPNTFYSYLTESEKALYVERILSELYWRDLFARMDKVRLEMKGVSS